MTTMCTIQDIEKTMGGTIVAIDLCVRALSFVCVIRSVNAYADL